MLRSVFTVRRGRLAVAFEGGEVLETGAQNSGVGQQQTYAVHHLSRERVEQGQTKTMMASNAVDLAYSADASMLAVVTEDKRIWVWRRTSSGYEVKKRERPLSTPKEKGETEPLDERQELLGWRELPKKPTSVTFAPAAAGDRYSGSEKGEVVVIADKCGDAHAAPLPDPSLALKHLLGHTAMTITAMVSLREGSLLATADRAEHIRVSQFPRTSIVHAYLLGHTDFVSALASVPGESSLLLSGSGDGMVGLWDAERGEKLDMISVRQACQGLAEGDEPASAAVGTSHDTGGLLTQHEPLAEGCDENREKGEGDVLSKGAARMNLEEMGIEQGVEDGGIGADGGGGSCDVKMAERGNKVERCRNGKESRRGGGSARGGDGDKGTEKGAEKEGAEEGRGVDEDGQEGGVPLSIACSQNGKTVAVAVSGLKGLLLLAVSRGGAPGKQAVRLVPRARLQLPTVPIQAGFLDGDLIVALPSASSDDFFQAFRLTEGRDGAILASDGTSTAQAKCSAITSAARKQALHRDGGYVLKAAVPDEDASEALGGGLRKHKGTRNGGKSRSNDWNNFSKRRDKKLDRKRRRTVTTQSSVGVGEPKAQPLPRIEVAPPVVLP